MPGPHWWGQLFKALSFSQLAPFPSCCRSHVCRAGRCFAGVNALGEGGLCPLVLSRRSLGADGAFSGTARGGGRLPYPHSVLPPARLGEPYAFSVSRRPTVGSVQTHS